MQALENRIPPPIIMLATAGLMWLYAFEQTSISTSFWRIVAAVAIAAAGAALAIAGFRGLRRNHTTPNPINIEKTSALVTDGVFAFTRNPIYLGMALWLLAWAIGLGNSVVLLGPLFFVAYITRFQILPEERVISAKFPSDFANYRKTTRRWF